MQTTPICQLVEQVQEEPELVHLPPSKPTTGVGRWWRRGIRQGYTGQSLVEFAISLPFLIFLVLTLVEMGFLIRGHLTVSNAVREGVRAASQAGDYRPVYTGMYLPMEGPPTIPANALPNAGDEYSSSDLRMLQPGTDGDAMLVANVSSSLQDKLKDAYFLMTYRADSSDSTDYGLVKNKGDRWGVVYIASDNDPQIHDWAWGTTNPYQRVFQHIPQTLWVTITKASPNVTVTVPYIREGWIAGVMDGGIFTYTISLPFTLSTMSKAGYTIKAQSDPLTITEVIGVAYPPGNPNAKESNLLLVRRFTQTCPVGPTPNPVNQNGYYYRGNVITTLKAFCGSNDPNLHITPATEGYGGDGTGIVPAGKAGAGKMIGDLWVASFKADPWYPTWRYAGGFCDIRKPTATVGDANYYNNLKNSPDWLGVRLDYYHYWLTNWFGLPPFALSDKAVKILEPVSRPTPEWKCHLTRN